jgi:hypothetical protein
MNDDHAFTALRHRLTEVRESLHDEHMTTPATEIFARNKRRNVRRGLVATAAGCAAIGLAAALTFSPGSAAQPGQAHHAQRAQLAAWTVRANSNGTVSFTLRNTSHPAQLQHALAEAGVPAVVTWGTICEAGGPGQPVMDTEAFLQSGSAMDPDPASWFALPGGVTTSNPDLDWSWIITPSQMPSGGHFVISAEPGKVPASDIQATWEFARTSAPLVCGKHMKV